ncbi:hypothetical protein FHP26_21730 [Pseudomonas orientalis]|nr:hypothetical protein [Pseudomonas orientalis]
MKIVPTLCGGMYPVTLCVSVLRQDAERPRRHSHAERGNDRQRIKFTDPEYPCAVSPDPAASSFSRWRCAS